MASKASWKDDWSRRVQVMDAASRAGVGFYESPMKLIDPEPKPSFIESWIKQNAEQKGKEQQQLDKWLENAIVAVCVAGLILSGLAIIAVQIALLLFTFLAVVIGAFAVSSMFKGGGSSE